MKRLRHGQCVGGKDSREYVSYMKMRQRCINPRNRAYKYYGGRGITVCQRWLGPNGFKNFLADMGPRPIGKSLDRFPNNNGNYEPKNCRWPKCEFCRRMPATLECDYELSRNLLGEPILCNAKMCWVCSRQVGEDRDYCPRHS
jgi:hypothetical protein